MAWTFYNASGEQMIEDGAMSIANNTNNRVVTATGADPASLNGEANLTFDGTNLTVGTGNVIVGTAGKGIDFSNQSSPAAAMTSELLDHYEEGTWEPGIGDSGTLNATSESQSYHGANSGHYVRIGNTVFIHGRLLLTSKGTMTDGNTAHLLGLPFASSSANYSTINMAQSTAGGAAGMSITAGHYVSGGIGTSASQADLHVWDATVGTTGLLISELNLADVYISGQYLV